MKRCIAFDIDILQLDMDNTYGLKYIYASIFSIMSNSRESLSSLIEDLKQKGLFKFKVGSEYEGVDRYYKLYRAYDEGEPGNNWIVDLAKYIVDLNNQDNTEAVLRLNKLRVLESEILDMSVALGESVAEPRYYINTYVKQLRKLLKQYNVDEILQVENVGRALGDIDATISDNKIYIVEK